MSNKRFAHSATEKAYTIFDTKKDQTFQWEGGYSEALMHERILNQFPNEKYCTKCFKRLWASDTTCSACAK